MENAQKTVEQLQADKDKLLAWIHYMAGSTGIGGPTSLCQFEMLEEYQRRVVYPDCTKQVSTTSTGATITKWIHNETREEVYR